MVGDGITSCLVDLVKFIVVLAFALGVLCAIAGLTKYVVSGFAGHEVGNFKTYLGAWFLYYMLRSEVKGVLRYLGGTL